MSAVVLDELDSRLLLLPKLKMAVYGRRDEEIRPKQNTVFRFSVDLEWRRGALCDDAKVNLVAVHKALVVLVGARELLEEEVFIWQD
jgi:hypothetical protein